MTSGPNILQIQRICAINSVYVLYRTAYCKELEGNTTLADIGINGRQETKTMHRIMKDDIGLDKDCSIVQRENR